MLPVPRNGKVITSTLLTTPGHHSRIPATVLCGAIRIRFFATDDGIPVGAKIEFFVGTRNEYEAEQGRKKHSGGLLAPAEPIMPAV